MSFVQYIHRDVLSALPNCAECGGPAVDGRHTSPSPGVPCRDGFPVGPSGCTNPNVHHLYRLPVSYFDTYVVEEMTA